LTNKCYIFAEIKNQLKMKKYLGIKTVSAEPMTRVEAGKAGLVRNWNPKDSSNYDGTVSVSGYKVVYEDGYESWSPKETFEKAYRLTDGLTFGDAVEALKQCKRVARKGWNGKDMYLFLGNGGEKRCDFLDRIGVESNGVLEIRSTICELVARHFGDDAAVAANFDERKLFETPPSIIMKTADDKLCIGWLASQTDMLAEDWEIVE
jgi:hypothetical protein